MTKMLKVGIVSLLLLTCVTGANPFTPLWNWENEKLFGNVKEIVTQNKIGKIVETYNEKGQKTKVIYKSEDEETAILQYNKDGDLYKLTVYNDGVVKPVFVETAEYKEKGIIKSLVRIREGKMEKSGKFEYDKKKRLKSITTKDDLESRVFTYEFDDKGNLIADSLIVGDFEESIKYTKFQKGNPTVSEFYFGTILVSTTTYEYKYDKAGNWIEKKIVTKVHHDKPGEKVRDPKIIKRTITYYPEKENSDNENSSGGLKPAKK